MSITRRRKQNKNRRRMKGTEGEIEERNDDEINEDDDEYDEKNMEDGE